MPSPKQTDIIADKEDIYKTVDTVHAQIKILETFIARRFDEISMEINATSQQVDMAEDGMAQRMAEVLEVLGAINYSGDGSSAANTGVELESVIEDTAREANKILDAADVIMEEVSPSKDWDDKAVRESAREKIQSCVQDILLACSFQDRTGQRIRNTLNNLHGIEDRLNSTFEKLGIEIKPDNTAVQDKVKAGMSQGDVDGLFD